MHRHIAIQAHPIQLIDKPFIKTVSGIRQLGGTTGGAQGEVWETLLYWFQVAHPPVSEVICLVLSTTAQSKACNVPGAHGHDSVAGDCPGIAMHNGGFIGFTPKSLDTQPHHWVIPIQ